MIITSEIYQGNINLYYKSGLSLDFVFKNCDKVFRFDEFSQTGTTYEEFTDGHIEDDELIQKIQNCKRPYLCESPSCSFLVLDGEAVFVFGLFCKRFDCLNYQPKLRTLSEFASYVSSPNNNENRDILERFILDSTNRMATLYNEYHVFHFSNVNLHSQGLFKLDKSTSVFLESKFGVDVCMNISSFLSPCCQDDWTNNSSHNRKVTIVDGLFHNDDNGISLPFEVPLFTPSSVFDKLKEKISISPKHMYLIYKNPTVSKSKLCCEGVEVKRFELMFLRNVFKSINSHYFFPGYKKSILPKETIEEYRKLWHEHDFLYADELLKVEPEVEITGRPYGDFFDIKMEYFYLNKYHAVEKTPREHELLKKYKAELRPIDFSLPRADKKSLSRSEYKKLKKKRMQMLARMKDPARREINRLVTTSIVRKKPGTHRCTWVELGEVAAKASRLCRRSHMKTCVWKGQYCLKNWDHNKPPDCTYKNLYDWVKAAAIPEGLTEAEFDRKTKLKAEIMKEVYKKLTLPEKTEIDWQEGNWKAGDPYPKEHLIKLRVKCYQGIIRKKECPSRTFSHVEVIEEKLESYRQEKLKRAKEEFQKEVDTWYVEENFEELEGANLFNEDDADY